MVDRLLPLNFSVEHIPGINMGFFECFSRHFQSKSITSSQKDENFVINLIGTFKFILKKADKISSNRNADHELEQNDVTNTKIGKQTEQHALGHSLYTNQLQSSIQISQNLNNCKSIVIVCTRNTISV